MSTEGELYGRVCERWGTDPGELVAGDEVLAMNLRAGLGYVLLQRSETEPQATSHEELVAQARRSSQVVREMRQGG